MSAGDKVVRPIFFGKGLDQVDEIQQAAQTIRQELKSVDERLVNSNWLVGREISAADINLFPLVQLFLRAASKEAAQPFNLGLIPLAQTLSKHCPLGKPDRGVAQLPAHLSAALAISANSNSPTH